MKNFKIKLKLHRQSGMTLVELMVAMVILAIIATAAVPSMRDIFTRKSVQSIAKHFERSIKLARVEATQRSTAVTVKPTSNSNDWSQGWRVEFTDTDNNVQLIKVFDALPANVIFTSDTFNASTDLIILPTGQAQTIGAFDLYFPQCTGNERYGFNLLLSGIIQRGLRPCTTI